MAMRLMNCISSVCHNPVNTRVQEVGQLYIEPSKKVVTSAWEEWFGSLFFWASLNKVRGHDWKRSMTDTCNEKVVKEILSIKVGYALSWQSQVPCK